MIYDRKIHITTEQLADLLGVREGELAGGIRKYGGPKALGRARVNGRQQSVYCRFLAAAWVDDHRDAIKPEPKPEKVPPREIKPLHEQGVYRPSAQLSVNLERSAALYGHRLVTPSTGEGNHRQFAFGHDSVRLTR